MSGDIGPGTLVVCVDASTKAALKEGRVYRVSALGFTALGNPAVDVEGIERVPPLEHPNYWVKRFRKLNDGEDDAELIARIRECRPSRVPVTAGKFPCPAEGGDVSPVVALNPSDDRSL